MAWGWGSSYLSLSLLTSLTLPHTDESERAHDDVYNDKHEGKFSHELVGGAASFAAMKAYNDSREKKGTLLSTTLMKRILLTVPQAKRSNIPSQRSCLLALSEERSTSWPRPRVSTRPIGFVLTNTQRRTRTRCMMIAMVVMMTLDTR